MDPPCRTQGFKLSKFSITFLALLSLKFLGKSASPLITLSYISQGFSVLAPNGNSPTINSYIMTPKDHKSTSSLYYLPKITSGAMQCGVPIVVEVRWLSEMHLADPKDTRLGYPFQSITKLSGFKSLTTIYWDISFSIISRMVEAQNWQSRVLSNPISLIVSQRASPLINSQTFITTLSQSITSYILGTKGCLNMEQTSISCLTTVSKLFLSMCFLLYCLPMRLLLSYFRRMRLLSFPFQMSPWQVRLSMFIFQRTGFDIYSVDFMMPDIFSKSNLMLKRSSQMSTLSVSTMMSSSSLTFSEDLRQSSPHSSPDQARHLALLNFLILPSIITMSRLMVVPLQNTTLLALQYFLLIPLKNISSSFFNKLNNFLFF